MIKNGNQGRFPLHVAVIRAPLGPFAPGGFAGDTFAVGDPAPDPSGDPAVEPAVEPVTEPVENSAHETLPVTVGSDDKKDAAFNELPDVTPAPGEDAADDDDANVLDTYHDKTGRFRKGNPGRPPAGANTPPVSDLAGELGAGAELLRKRLCDTILGLSKSKLEKVILGVKQPEHLLSSLLNLTSAQGEGKGVQIISAVPTVQHRAAQSDQQPDQQPALPDTQATASPRTARVSALSDQRPEKVQSTVPQRKWFYDGSDDELLTSHPNDGQLWGISNGGDKTSADAMRGAAIGSIFTPLRAASTAGLSGGALVCMAVRSMTVTPDRLLASRSSGESFGTNRHWQKTCGGRVVKLLANVTFQRWVSGSIDVASRTSGMTSMLVSDTT